MHAAVLVIEAGRWHSDDTLAYQALKISEVPVLLAINKIDRVKAEVLLALAERMNDAFPFVKTFMISAEKGYGVADLKAWLAGELPLAGCCKLGAITPTEPGLVCPCILRPMDCGRLLTEFAWNVCVVGYIWCLNLL